MTFLGAGNDNEVNQFEHGLDRVSPGNGEANYLRTFFSAWRNLAFVLVGRVQRFAPMVKKYSGKKKDAKRKFRFFVRRDFGRGRN